MSSKPVKTFRAVLEKVQSTPPWVIARLPFDPAKAWPEWNSRRVRGSLNGFEFRTSLLKTKGQGYWFVVYKKMLTAVHAKAGDKVAVCLEPDLEAHVYNEPRELTAVLRQDRDLRRWFDSMTPSTRRWFAMFVDQAKGPQTRKQRAERIAEMVMQVIEGEEIPPPVLRLAFQRQPLAEQGWHASTPAQRRSLEKCVQVAQRKCGPHED
jgi:hypothetical protein